MREVAGAPERHGPTAPIKLNHQRGSGTKRETQTAESLDARLAGEESIGTPADRTAHIAFIMPRFAHDDVRASHKEAWSLRHSGYQVVLVCRDAPVQKYLGMRVIAARAHAQGLLRPIVNTPRLLRQALRLKADLYVLENPDTLLVAFLLSLMRKRVVYSSHEDFLRKAEIHPRIPRMLRRLFGFAIVACEFMLARMTAATVVTQPSVRQRYHPCAILVENAPLTHGPILDRAGQIYSQLPSTDMPTLVYAGGIRRSRGLDRMLELVARLNEIQPWKLKLLGRFTYSGALRKAETHAGWRYVDYFGHVHHSVSLAHIRSADIGLALLDNIGGYAEASITKLYEYMLMETPFVASDFRVWRESIDDTAAGLFVDTDDMAALASQINELIADRERYQRMQASGRQFIEQTFNWRIVSAPIQNAVRNLVGEGSNVSVRDERHRRQLAL